MPVTVKLTQTVTLSSKTITRIKPALEAGEPVTISPNVLLDEVQCDSLRLQLGIPDPTPAPTPAPTITSASVTPLSLPAGGGSVTVDATVTDATQLAINGATVSSLPAQVSVTATGTITLTATGPGGSASWTSPTIVVAATQPPPPAGTKGVWTNPVPSGASPTLLEADQYNLAYDSTRSALWGVGWSMQVGRYKPGTGWAIFNEGSGGNFHNRAFCFDTDRDRLYASAGTPGPYTDQLSYFSPADEQWHVHPTTGESVPAQECAFIYRQGKIIAFGGWHRLPVKVIDLATGVISAVAGSPTLPAGVDADNFSAQRTAVVGDTAYILHSTGVYTLDLTNLTAGFTKLATTGNPPVHLTWCYAAHIDSFVGIVGLDGVMPGDGPQRGETWVLPRATLAWRKDAYYVAPVDGQPPPPLHPEPWPSMVQWGVGYVDGVVVAHDTGQRFAPATWHWNTDGAAPAPTPTPTPTPTPAPQPPGSTTGMLTRVPMPPSGTGPFVLWGESKQVNGVDALNGRIVFQGGDWTRSGTDGTHSCDLNGADWREDVPGSFSPSPSGMQDGAGFVMRSATQAIAFGAYPQTYIYNRADDARGSWELDVPTMRYTQRLDLPSGTGCDWGGVYHRPSDCIIAVDTYRVQRWNWATGQYSSHPISLPGIPAGHVAYIHRARPVLIGDQLYTVGYTTDGESDRRAYLCRIDLNTYAVTKLADPPVPTNLVHDSTNMMTQLAMSNGKIFWPVIAGPEGVIHHLLVYDPPVNRWLEDAQRPTQGAFLANSITPLADGRVMMAGAAMGPQKHDSIWFYKAA